MKKVFRTYPITDLNVRADDDGVTHVEGYAALFDVMSKPLGALGGAREKILPGAFRRAVEQDDVRLLINHDPNLLLARNKAGTLSLKEDERGLFYDAKLPDTSYARDLVESMKRGDINQNSFGFQIDDSQWVKENAEDVHVISAVKLWDVSVVTFPAYDETFAQLRSVSEFLSAEKKIDRKDVDEIKNVLQGLLEKLPSDESRGGADEIGHEVMAEIRRRELELFELEA